MAKELDNKKMWASLIKHTTVSWIGTLIKKALKDQSFEFNGNEIVPIEPKFNVGDYVMHCNEKDIIYQVEKVFLDGTYRIVPLDAPEGKAFTSATEGAMRLWTIADAKDGDVLYYNNLLNHGSGIMIYKKDKSSEYVINKYCSCNEFGFEVESYIVLNDGFVSPATKEQRDQLEKAMFDAGYEWDAVKKKLKELSHSESTKKSGQDKMTEFELAIHRRLNLLRGEWLDDEYLEKETRGMAKELMTIARKQIAEENGSYQIIGQKPKYKDEDWLLNK